MTSEQDQRVATVVEQEDTIEQLRAENERLKAELAKKDDLIKKLRKSYELVRITLESVMETLVEVKVQAMYRIMQASQFCRIMGVALRNTPFRQFCDSTRNFLDATRLPSEITSVTHADFIYPIDEVGCDPSLH